MIVTLREWQYTTAEDAALATQRFTGELKRRLGPDAAAALKAYLRVTGPCGSHNGFDVELAARWALAYQKARAFAACKLDAGDKAYFEARPVAG